MTTATTQPGPAHADARALRHDPRPGDEQAVIRIRGLKKTYRMGAERVHALRGVDLAIRRNEFVAIMGASGSGKSTMMNILGCLDRPTDGEYVLNGEPTHKMGPRALASVRNEQIGFVFQTFELLSRSSALKNVMLPMIYSAKNWLSARKKAEAALTRVGLGDRMHHRPNQLSGGQRQRVAIARALVNDPAIVLADEPTGNLDTKTTEDIIDLFDQLHHEGQTIVMVTHEEDVAGRAERIVRLRDGLMMSDHATLHDPIHREFLKFAAAANERASAKLARADDGTHGGAEADEQAGAAADAPAAQDPATRHPSTHHPEASS